MNHNITIYRAGAQLLTVKANATYSHRMHGEYRITAQIPRADSLQLQINDYLEHKGEQFRINTMPEISQSGPQRLDYTFVFEASIYTLSRKKLRHEGAKKFNYYGTPNDFLQLFIANISEIEPDWTIAACESLPPKNIYFDGLDVRQALTKMAEEFGLEYAVKNKAFTLKKTIGTDTANILEQDASAHSITLKALDKSRLITKLWLYGGEKNIEHTYRNNARQLTTSAGYITKNTELYGVIEDDYENAEIYPRRTATITAIHNSKTVEDSTIDFDLNTHLLEGQTAKIVFKSGDLAGNEFEIYSYSHATKRISFNQLQQENDYILPNEVRYPRVGDQYTFVNIKMPQAYIDAAEAELQSEGQAHIDKYSNPLASLDVKPAKNYLRRHQSDLQVSDRLTIKAPRIGINRLIRIAGISYPLSDPFDITLELSDEITYDRQTATEISIIKNEREIKKDKVINAQSAREAASRLRNLKEYIFNPDGTYNMSHFAAGSVSTQMLHVGAISQNFVLAETLINLNISGNANIVQVAAGQLIHFELDIPGVGFTWQLPYKQLTGLDSSAAYYLYARCSKTQLTGTWEINTAQRKADFEEGFYWFLIGVIYPAKDGVRYMDNLYGNASIVGDRITAGKIKSLDGSTEFDLTNSRIRGNIEFVSSGQPKDLATWAGVKENEITANQAAISQEEAARIADADAKLTEAKAHAAELDKDVFDAAKQYVDVFPDSLFPAIEYWKNAVIVDVVDGAVGNKVHKSLATTEPFKALAIDRKQKIKLSFYARKKDGYDGLFYTGIRMFSDPENFLDNGNGGYGHYAGLQYSLTNEWKKFEVIFFASSFPEAKFYKPHFLGSYAHTGGYFEVQNVEVLDVTDIVRLSSDILQSKTDSIAASTAHAEAVAEQKRIEAEANADGKITAAEQRAMADATNKSDAAKNYAAAQDSLLSTQLQSYADGKVTAEEQARINDAQNKLAAAKAYAEAAANTAKIAAEAHADGKVTAEEAARIADADAKLAEAKAHAAELDNALKPQAKISSLVEDLQDWKLDGQTIATINDGKEGDKVLRISDLVAYSESKTFIAFDKSKIYKTRFWARKSTDADGIFYFGLRQFGKDYSPIPINSGYGAYSQTRYLTNEWKLYEDTWYYSALYSDTTYFKPSFLNNYQGSTGYFEIQGFRIWDATEELKLSADILQSKTDSIAASTAHAEAVAEQKRIEAEANADGKITAAEQRAMADATNKTDAAKNYAAAQDALLSTQLQSYADGKVTAEEQARINDAQNKLAAAKAYAEAAANAAKIAAEAHADGKVTAEEAARIADADAKLAEAKAHAAELDAAIQIGGRNYFSLRTCYIQGYTKDWTDANVDLIRFTDGFDFVGESNGFRALRVGNCIKGNGEWTISFLCWCNFDNQSLKIDVCDTNNTIIQVDKTPKKIVLTTNVTNYGDGSVYNFIDFEQIPFVYLHVRELMVEQSNKPSTYRRAPEDVEADILQSKTESINASKTYSEAVAEQKRIEAEANADGKITAAEQRAMADATNKSDAAKNYAAAQDALLSTQLQSYADGKVTAEEQARINDAQNKLAAAKAYAEAAANAAKIAAEAHADGKVTAEEAARIADADAKLAEAKAHADAVANAAEAVAQQALNKAAGADYVTEAFQSTSSDQGGIRLAKIMAVQRADGSVASYMNGLASNPTAFAAGVTSFGLPTEQKKAEITHDGYILGTHVVFKSPNLETEGGIFFSSLAKVLSFHYNGGQKGLEIKLLPEGPAITMLKRDGTIVWKLGDNGFYYQSETPESISPVSPFIFTSQVNKNMSDTDINNLKLFIWNGYRREYIPGSNNYLYKIKYRYIASTFYHYNPGNNPYVQINKQYEGLHVENSKTSAFIQNGWYLMDTELTAEDPAPYFDTSIDSSILIQLGYYENGMYIQDRQLQMSSNDFY